MTCLVDDTHAAGIFFPAQNGVVTFPALSAIAGGKSGEYTIVFSVPERNDIEPFKLSFLYSDGTT